MQVYKAKADSIIAERMVNSLANKVKLVDLFVSFPDSTKSCFLEYKSNKDKKIKFRTVSFFFELYSSSLDYSFRFPIIVTKDKSLESDLPFFEGIPKCVIENKSCNFITKDNAIRIAINDSILYQDNLKVILIPENKKDVYYWEVSGSPKIHKKNKPKSINIVHRQRRIINTISGVIIRRN
ncbi:hypothetical protein [Ferruginibacter sp.]